MTRYLLALLLLASLASAAAPPVLVVTTGQTVSETLACSGASSSPCGVNSTSTLVLNANGARGQCLIQNVGLAAVYCTHGVNAASTSTFHFVLAPASAQWGGSGGSYTCNQGPATWRGAITCGGAGSTSTLAVSAASVLGY
jgi:hypothetical protein